MNLFIEQGLKYKNYNLKENRLLFSEEQELLINNNFYNSACNNCFYIPKLMTAE